MRDVLPEPYPDEFLYGVLARAQRVRTTTLILLPNGVYGACTGYQYPLLSTCGVAPALAAGMYSSPAHTAHLLVQRHSVLPLAAAFLHPSAQPNFANLCVSKSSSHAAVPQIRRLLGGAGSGHKGRRLWYCPACVAADHAVVGEPYWHLWHFLPYSVVCADHGCWLRSRDVPARYPVWGPSDPQLRAPIHPSPRHRPPTVLQDLARLERSLLFLGREGASLCSAVFNKRIMLLASSSSSEALALGNAISLRTALQVRTGIDLDELERFTGRRVSADALGHLYGILRRGSMSAATGTLLTFLLGFDDSSVQQLVSADCSTDGPSSVDLCGVRLCTRFAPDWQLLLADYLTPTRLLVRAVCSKCGFSAYRRMGHDAAVIRRQGSTVSQTLEELVAEGICGSRDLRRVLGLSPRALNNALTFLRKRTHSETAQASEPRVTPARQPRRSRPRGKKRLIETFRW